MNSWRVSVAVPLVIVMAGMTGYGRASELPSSAQTSVTLSSAANAADSFAIAQFFEASGLAFFNVPGSLTGPGKLLTGCAAQSGTQWLCISYVTRISKTITPAVIRTAETNSNPHGVWGQIVKLRNGRLYEFTAADVDEHSSPISLRSLVSQDGRPPAGVRTGRLTFYYSSAKTSRNFTVTL